MDIALQCVRAWFKGKTVICLPCACPLIKIHTAPIFQMDALVFQVLPCMVHWWDLHRQARLWVWSEQKHKCIWVEGSNLNKYLSLHTLIADKECHHDQCPHRPCHHQGGESWWHVLHWSRHWQRGSRYLPHSICWSPEPYIHYIALHYIRVCCISPLYLLVKSNLVQLVLVMHNAVKCRVWLSWVTFGRWAGVGLTT